MQEWKEKRKNIQHYDAQAAIYDKQYVSEQETKIDDALENLSFGSEELVLDLGCGPGFLFRHISEKVGFIVAIDSSRKALLQAKNRIKNMFNIMLVRADADNTPFPDNIFEKVFALTVLQNMPEPTITVNEIRRISKPYAIFVVTGLKKKFSQENFVNILKRSGLNVVKLNSGNQLKDYVAVCSKF